MKTEYTVWFYVDDQGGWNAEVPDLPGCYACGDTKEEVQANAKEAIEAIILGKHQLVLPIVGAFPDKAGGSPILRMPT